MSAPVVAGLVVPAPVLLGSIGISEADSPAATRPNVERDRLAPMPPRVPSERLVERTPEPVASRRDPREPDHRTEPRIDTFAAALSLGPASAPKPQATSPEEPVEVPPALAGLLTASPGAKSKLSGQLDAVKRGFATLGNDSAYLAAAGQRREHANVTALGDKVFAARLDLTRQYLLRVAMQQDPMAFALYALRESYCLTTQRMIDEAIKIRKANDLRKAIRAEAQRAADVQQAWAAAVRESGDENWISPEALPWLEVDAERGELLLTDASTTEAEWLHTDDDEAEQGRATRREEEKLLWGPSRLTPHEKDRLKALTKKRGWWGSGTDDFIADHIDEAARILSKMNARELEKWLPKFIGKLDGASSNEDDARRIVKALDPAQLANYIAHAPQGRTRDLKDALGDEYWEDLSIRLRDFARSVGAPLDGCEAWETVPAVRELGKRIDTLLRRERDAAPSDQTAASGASEVPDQNGVQPGAGETEYSHLPTHARAIRTPKQLEDYRDYLEQHLNSVGEDAELMNVTLQSLLQQQQQCMQMLSNMSKVAHDGAMSVVRRIGS